jgi:hypothetical protein
MNSDRESLERKSKAIAERTWETDDELGDQGPGETGDSDQCFVSPRRDFSASP